MPPGPTLRKRLYKAVWMFDVAVRSGVHRMLSGYIVLSCSIQYFLVGTAFLIPQPQPSCWRFRRPETWVVRPTPRFERLPTILKCNKRKSSPLGVKVTRWDTTRQGGSKKLEGLSTLGEF